MLELEGGCHCRRVRFRVRIAADVETTILECDCTICRMKGFLHLIVERAEFDLISGEDALTTYTFNTHVAKHRFCNVCGVHPFYVPRSHPDGMDVNVRCLDAFETVRERFRIKPFHGQDWEANVASIR